MAVSRQPLGAHSFHHVCVHEFVCQVVFWFNPPCFISHYGSLFCILEKQNYRVVLRGFLTLGAMEIVVWGANLNSKHGHFMAADAVEGEEWYKPKKTVCLFVCGKSLGRRYTHDYD